MKITKARVQQIIAEEYQRILNEEKQQDQSGSDDQDVKNRGQLLTILKQKFAPQLQKASGITGEEPSLLLDLFQFIVNVLNQKAVDSDKAETMKAKILQTVGQVK
jgi:hypothetical protein